MVVLAPHGDVAKALPLVRLATQEIIVPVESVVGLEPLSSTLSYKHMPILEPNIVLVRRWQRLESLVTDIRGVNILSLLCFVLV